MAKEYSQGVISYDDTVSRRTDYLYRVSLKCLVSDDHGRVLVVKETGRKSWDLPGGGMDHNEDIRTSIAREMAEEVNFAGDFTYRVIYVDEPAYLNAHDFWQLRLVFEVKPEDMTFSAGEDGDEIAFMNPEDFQNSDIEVERRIYKYCQLLSFL